MYQFKTQTQCDREEHEQLVDSIIAQYKKEKPEKKITQEEWDQVNLNITSLKENGYHNYV